MHDARPATLPHDDPGRPPLDPGDAWWRQKRPRPKGLRFTDGPVERVIERAMPPRPVQPGNYGSSAEQCIGSPFAGID